MARYNYSPTLWVGGETIGTSQIMNNIENGILNSFLYTDSISEILNNHITDHPSGGGGVNIEPATEEEINALFGVV